MSKRSWEENYQLLVVYKKEHGNCDVPSTFVDNILANWVKYQRQAPLDSDKTKKLDTLGFRWAIKKYTDDHGDRWHSQYVKLRRLHQHGKRTNPYDKTLGLWMTRQRKRKHCKRLPKYYASLLDDIGFDWTINRADSTTKLPTKADDNVPVKAVVKAAGKATVTAREDRETQVVRGEWVRYEFQDGWFDGQVVAQTKKSHRIRFTDGREKLFAKDALLEMASDYQIHYNTHLGAAPGTHTRGATRIEASPAQASRNGEKYICDSDSEDEGFLTLRAQNHKTKKHTATRSDAPMSASNSYERLHPRLKVLCSILNSDESKDEDVQMCEDAINELIEVTAGLSKCAKTRSLR